MRALTLTVDAALPKLAWYATYNPSADTCDVEVGSFVERDAAAHPQWIASGFWSGDFEAGRFHEAQHLFGSGLRLDEDGLHVVPASTTVERCVYARDGEVWRLSNSLVVLLGRMGARLDPNVDHALWSESPCRGIHAYLRQIPVQHPGISTVSQVIYESLRFAPNGAQTFRMPGAATTFDSFDAYETRLNDELKLLWANASDPKRVRPMRAVTTTSRGYDSAAVTALVTKLIPNVTSWSATHSNTRIPSLLRGLMPVDVLDDDGRDIAKRLGATPRLLVSELTNVPAQLEAWCWASGQSSPELIFHALLSEAGTHDAPTVWFTGHTGDSVWSRSPNAGVMSGHLNRAAQSGCSLIEARLAFGVIDCSVPYLFARNMTSIARITNSPAMQQWQLGNDYDRPIPRRIVEERGVPRRWFGFGKKAVTHDYESPAGSELRAVFFQRTQWTHAMEALYRSVNLGLFFAYRLMHFVRLNGDRSKLLQTASRNDKRTLAVLRDLHQHTFLMCVDMLSERYVVRKPLPEPAVTVAAPARKPHVVRAPAQARATE